MKLRWQRKSRLFSILWALIILAFSILIFNVSWFEKSYGTHDVRSPSKQISAVERSVKLHSCYDSKNQLWKLPAVPHFIIAGVQKGGTSALRALLVQHPQLIASMKFEPHYFDQRLSRYLLNQYQSTEIKPAWLCDIQRHYIQTTFHPEILQQALSNNLFFYEKTPSYFVDPDVPALMDRVCTWKPKILVMLRDPIERAFSHYKMEREKKRVKEDFDFLLNQEIKLLRKVGVSKAPLLPINMTQNQRTEFLARIPSNQFELLKLGPQTSDDAHRQIIQNLTYANFLQRGMYSVQLERWLKYFHLGESLLVVKFEEFQNDPARIYKDVLDFIGIPFYELRPQDFQKTYQTRGVQRQKSMKHQALSDETRKYLELFYRPYNNQLAKLLGKRLFR